MIYGSVCSGIEAATAAWHPIGWRPAFFSEIDPFPRAVLAHHYPDVPLRGDFTEIQAGDHAAIDLLVGGTPCQSFSVAGLRGGLDDDRGNLALEFLRLADRLRPRWLVWENVPGVLSSNGGRDFGAILGGMVELGYGFAYRVLDAQYVRTQRFPRAVPQRRRRVFVVGHLGDWRAAAAVLFERDSLSGNPAPRREAGQGTAGRAAPRAAVGVDLQNVAVLEGLSGTLDTGMARGNRGQGVIAPVVARCDATREGSSQDWESTTMVAHSLRAEGFDASEDGTGRGTPLVPAGVTIHGTDGTTSVASFCDTASALRSRIPSGVENSTTTAVMSPIAFHPTQDPISSEGACHALGTGSAQGCATAADAFDAVQITSRAIRTRVEPGLPVPTLVKQSRMHVASPMAVRRLTPRECERLMGYRDDFTLVPYRGKPAADGPRYKALGNSMAVNVMDFIGQRIDAVDKLLRELARKGAA
jgi:DNA (cytosine-5)-methyltransferase 1